MRSTPSWAPGAERARERTARHRVVALRRSVAAAPSQEPSGPPQRASAQRPADPRAHRRRP
ncbi:MAG: hypothetical protein LBE67_03875 [Kocuria palustris]|nr:hypothetical protein [Kocuria palustris]